MPIRRTKKVAAKVINPCSYCIYYGDPGGIRTPDPRLRSIQDNASTMRFSGSTLSVMAYLKVQFLYFLSQSREIYAH